MKSQSRKFEEQMKLMNKFSQIIKELPSQEFQTFVFFVGFRANRRTFIWFSGSSKLELSALPIFIEFQLFCRFDKDTVEGWRDWKWMRALGERGCALLLRTIRFST